MKSKQHPGTFIFPCKTIDFQPINKLCSSHIVKQIEVIFLDPIHHIIHSIRLHRHYKICLSITLLLLDFDGTLLGQWFSHVGVAHTNSVAKVFQSLLLTGIVWQQLPTSRIWDPGQSNCFPLPVLACSPCHGLRSLAVHFLVARSTSASPSPSLLPGR